MQDAASTLSTDLLQPIFSQLHDAIYIVEPSSGQILEANPAAEKILGLGRELLLNKTLLDLASEKMSESKWAAVVAEVMRAGEFVLTTYHQHKAGGRYPVEMKITRLDLHGKLYFTVLARVISLQERNHQHLDDNQFVQLFTLNEASDGLWDWNLASGALYFSPQWHRIFGYESQGSEYNSLNAWMDLVHKKDRERMLKILAMHLDGQTERYECQYRLLSASGEYRWVFDRGLVMLRDEHARPLRVLGMQLDVTEQYQLKQDIAYYQNTDPLTNIFNRSQGVRQLNYWFERPASPTLVAVMMKIDQLAQLNLHSCASGDQAICHVVEQAKLLGSSAELLYRWSSSELLLLLPSRDSRFACLWVEELRAALQRTPISYSGDEDITLTVSAGIAVRTQKTLTVEGLIKELTIALMQARVIGRNNSCVAPV